MTVTNTPDTRIRISWWRSSKEPNEEALNPRAINTKEKPSTNSNDCVRT